MKYVLRDLALGTESEVEIGKTEFDSIVSATKMFSAATDIEELYDSVIENYYEYEHELITILQRNMIFKGEEFIYWKFSGITSRRLMNFMSSARSYIDQVPQHLDTIFGKISDETRSFNEEKSIQYDSMLGYRVLEALRNYSQHHGYPIHNVSIGMNWHGDRNPAVWKHYINPTIFVPALARDPKFKRSVLKELEQLGEHVPINPFVREYIEGIANIHSKARHLLDPMIHGARSLLDIHVKSFKDSLLNEDRSDLDFIVAEKYDNESGASEQIFLPEYALKFHDYFRKKNNSHENISRRYLTSEQC
ncbi:hypothetical protein [Methylobacterium nodulans]|uniref:Uncharacterized protein n=1 Tax=Methylobacterium nodulans (strain LMG 21967 / CNCM I-2342 / ORS 2060) TaxID=460265 RepID=B8IMJ2_METNO|nr:hypothetical protein [Methylobacterium nodulans]ACL58378.1 hypothetical protein Mnod_3467 [Methylobacterium nodulans ORS 2060]